MILLINSSEQNEFELALKNDEKIISKKFPLRKYKDSEKALFFIDKFLNANNVEPKDLSAVSAVSGPGGFTSLRIAISIINTFSFVLNIPAVGIKKGEFNNLEEAFKVVEKGLKKVKVGDLVVPFYGKEPNITIKK